MTMIDWSSQTHFLPPLRSCTSPTSPDGIELRRLMSSPKSVQVEMTESRGAPYWLSQETNWANKKSNWVRQLLGRLDQLVPKDSLLAQHPLFNPYHADNVHTKWLPTGWAKAQQSQCTQLWHPIEAEVEINNASWNLLVIQNFKPQEIKRGSIGKHLELMTDKQWWWQPLTVSWQWNKQISGKQVK